MRQQEVQHAEGNAKQFLIVYGSMIGSLVSLVLLVVGIITNWQTFIRTSNLLILVLLILAIVGIPLLIIGICAYTATTALFGLPVYF